jgi:hypothetical protein
MTVDTLIEQARDLSDDERKQLIQALESMLPQSLPHKRRKLRDYRGVGAHVYDGTDAQDYVNQLRDEWDKHP